MQGTLLSVLLALRDTSTRLAQSAAVQVQPNLYPCLEACASIPCLEACASIPCLEASAVLQRAAYELLLTDLLVPGAALPCSLPHAINIFKFGCSSTDDQALQNQIEFRLFDDALKRGQNRCHGDDRFYDWLFESIAGRQYLPDGHTGMHDVDPSHGADFGSSA